MYKNYRVLIIGAAVSILLLCLWLNFIDVLPGCTENCNETIGLHFTHGAIRYKDCVDTRHRLGGILGGHVEVQIDSFVYGFEMKHENRFQWFYDHDTSHNSLFTKMHIEKWENRVKNDHLTSVYIPINESRKNSLKKIYDRNVKAPSYDYAFIGHRCASSFLKEINKVYNSKISDLKAIVSAFYPRLLRKRILKLSKKRNYKVKVQKGVKCKFWETD